MPLFDLIADRYERKFLIVTANQPFGEWDGLFVDKAMTSATVDRLVHHAAIFNLGSESFRKKQALENAAKRDSDAEKTDEPAKAQKPPAALRRAGQRSKQTSG